MTSEVHRVSAKWIMIPSIESFEKQEEFQDSRP